MAKSKTSPTGEATKLKAKASPPEVFKIPKPHPFPKIKKSSKAEIARQLAEYDDLLKSMREMCAVKKPTDIDAVELVRQQRRKDY